MKKQTTEKFSDQERFNWGYHDGAYDEERGQAQMNPTLVRKPGYQAGYEAGRRDQRDGAYRRDSSLAWLQHSEGIFS